jgi:NTE family protein
MTDVLVLGGGGVLGEAWMSALLAGAEERGFDARGCRAYVGTSAGSIVAASMTAGLDPRARLGSLPEPDAADAQAPPQAAAPLWHAVGAPLASVALAATRPAGALLRRAALARVPDGRRSLDDLRRHVERLGLSWDGRLRVAVVDLDSGRRVVFGSHGAPDVPVAVAVEASCAIPGYFRPVSWGGRTYVDGGAWSPTNMDAAPAGRGDRVVCLNPTGAVGGAFAVSRAAAGAEALALRRRGAHVTIVNPDAATAAAMGGTLANLMDARRRDDVIAAGLAQGRRLGASDALHAA